jgi:prepilin-type N-terminal cleavage/methylation domain-containing protein
MRKYIKREKGFSLIEVIVALALLGVISVPLLSATATTSTSRVTSEERSSAKILAESIMDNIKKQPYYTSYNITVPDDYAGYLADISVNNTQQYNLQKITVSVAHHGHDVISLEGYKVKR